MLSGGYYGFCFVSPPLQCVERFHCYQSNKKNIIASLLKFAGYIHNHKILPGNIFGHILKNKMATTGIFLTFSKDFCWPTRAKGIIGIGIIGEVMKSAYNSLIIDPRGLQFESNL